MGERRVEFVEFEGINGDPRRRFEILMGGIVHVLQPDKAVELAGWIIDLARENGVLPSAKADAEQDAVRQLRRATNALYLEVDASIADDVRRIASDVIDALSARQRDNEQLEAQDFWTNWVYPEGASPEDIQNELIDYRDLMRRFPVVLSHVTGGRLSKCTYPVDVMLRAIDDYIEELVGAALSEQERE